MPFIVAAVLFVLAVLVEAGMGFPAAGPWLSLVWLALVFAVWGVAAGWLLRGILFTSDEAATTGTVNSTRRGLLYLGGTALLALITGTIGVVDAIRKSAPEAEAAPVPGAVATSGTPGIAFEWQRGYGVLTMGEKQRPVAEAYVNDQKTHHAALMTIAALEYCAEIDEGPRDAGMAPAVMPAIVHDTSASYDIAGEMPF